MCVLNNGSRGPIVLPRVYTGVKMAQPLAYSPLEFQETKFPSILSMSRPYCTPWDYHRSKALNLRRMAEGGICCQLIDPAALGKIVDLTYTCYGRHPPEDGENVLT